MSDTKVGRVGEERVGEERVGEEKVGESVLLLCHLCISLPLSPLFFLSLLADW